MAGRYTFTNQRSKEAPMDFQWTNRSSVKPAWAADTEEPRTPRKRSHDALTPSTPSLTDTTNQPMFGSNQNVPFLFHPTPGPQTPHSHPWVPPPQFSPTKAFPATEIKDIDMTEASPLKGDDAKGNELVVKEKEGDKDRGRPVAAGGLRRVFKQRTRRLNGRRQRREEDEGPSSSADESDEDGNVVPHTQNTSNHYTLNMPAPPAPPSDTPYVLLGYLQFFFNLSLILIFLYLFVQFIITVQRDVGLRISEYSQDIIQEIGICALQFKNNNCDTISKTVPAMTQQCANWEACMNRDPTVIGRAKVGAELIAEVINGFVEPITWKTLIFTLTSLAFLTVFINTLLSLYRAKHQPTPAPVHHPAPPPFPYIAPGPAPKWSRYQDDQDLESPPRRRRLEGGLAAKIR
ncbi:Nucleus export protein BRL1 [Psilocybe cubensis]|uniref:Brl1/Brr6 domain-containing protein n=2 Tax=Psilocybe cubensis TaxID=181762 RepID=A0A8H8CR05_PSICU|nr:Nucleus export protein BRL1 [Psilocybe cubensis]KAH9487169.1 Nucleus export protein BRL1 [Psilocybe cubensis]